jgi:hypothetical protein
MSFAVSELDEADEAYDETMDESDEAYDEALPRIPRRPARPPVQTAPRQSAYRPRPDNNFVSQAQLQAALTRVSGQIATNSTAIKTLDGRVRGVSTEQVRLTTAMRKEVADRKKEEEGLRKELQSTRELAVLLPLIGGSNPLIGLLALGGGSMFGGGGTGGASGDSTGNLLMLALAFGGLGKK